LFALDDSLLNNSTIDDSYPDDSAKDETTKDNSAMGNSEKERMFVEIDENEWATIKSTMRLRHTVPNECSNCKMEYAFHVWKAADAGWPPGPHRTNFVPTRSYKMVEYIWSWIRRGWFVE
jgi:hypothetical protein